MYESYAPFDGRFLCRKASPSGDPSFGRTRNDRGERKFYDFIPLLLEKKYLKRIINCHGCAQTLNRGDLDGDGEITVLDVDCVVGQV